MEHSLLGLCFFDFYFVNGKKPSASWVFHYGFEPVFLVEKNKKTTSYAGGC